MPCRPALLWVWHQHVLAVARFPSFATTRARVVVRLQAKIPNVPPDLLSAPLLAASAPVNNNQRTQRILRGQGMLTGSIRNQVDQIWSAVWATGAANQLSVIEQVAQALAFIRRQRLSW
jgi:hypothetical protein